MTEMIAPARVSFSDGTPYTERYDDHYFSQEDGLSESIHVYLQGNNIPQRLAGTNAPFHIVETGFGTGLNFLLTWQAHVEAGQAQQLYFTSIEKHPLTRADIAHALQAFPSLAPLSTELLAQWPHLGHGIHRLHFHQVTLTLCFGDVSTHLPKLSEPVDAWYLDGFAPARNPQMWQAPLYQHMARLSRPWATAASFTSANPVRRGLERWGFSVEHAPGFGRKRHMTKALYNQAKGPMRPQTTPFWWCQRAPQVPAQRVAVIGAGIAGMQTAYALQRQGIEVTVFEASDEICAGASGNRQGALYIRPSLDPSPLATWQATAYQYALRQLKQLSLPSSAYDACGVLQLPLNDKDLQRQHKLLQGHPLYPNTMMRWCPAEEASELAGSKLTEGGLLFPDGGWVYPKAWMQALDVPVQLNHALVDLQNLGEQGWQLSFNNQTSKVFAQVVICCGWQAHEWIPSLNLKPIRGQVSTAQHTLNCQAVVCAERYITPALADGRQHFGATYGLNDSQQDVREADHQENLAQLQRRFPDATSDILAGRASVRATTPDTLPYVGAVANEYYLTWVQAGNRQRLPVTSGAPTKPGLYVNTGHGSRGLATSPLAGELIACMVTQTPAPVDLGIQAALSPMRGLYKQALKGH